jgi:hypothetical protein
VITRRLWRPIWSREPLMSQLSKLRQSRTQWKHKATQRAKQNRYQRKQLARVKHERDRTATSLKGQLMGVVERADVERRLASFYLLPGTDREIPSVICVL